MFAVLIYLWKTYKIYQNYPLFHHLRSTFLTFVECVYCLFLFPLVLGTMLLLHAKLDIFLCSLDSLLQKNVIVFSVLKNRISKWRSFEKKAIFNLIFTFFSYQGKVTKIPSAHISLTYIHICILLTLLIFFCLTNYEKYELIRNGFSLVRFLVLILFRAILEQSINNKTVSKI